jgi:hypothetical protein
MEKQEIFREVDKLQAADIQSVIAYCRFALCSRGVDPDKKIEYIPEPFPEEKGKPLLVVFKDDTDKDIVKEMLDIQDGYIDHDILYEFPFEAEAINVRYGRPYVAKLTYNKETEKIKRDFFPLDFMPHLLGGKEGLIVTVKGKFFLKEQEAVEIYLGAAHYDPETHGKKRYCICSGASGKLWEVDKNKLNSWLRGVIDWKDLWL